VYKSFAGFVSVGNIQLYKVFQLNWRTAERLRKRLLTLHFISDNDCNL